MKGRLRLCRLAGQRGATIVFVALAMVMLLGMAALAVDLGYLYVVKNELQNAADAGALAGAQVLYLNNGTAVNPGANGVATDYVQQNYSEQAQVEVLSVERGHWRFSDHTFTPNDSLEPVDLWDVTAAELDADDDFINAVKVVTRRKSAGGSVPDHFFARIFGAQPTDVTTTAVAYIGFAGKLEPFAVDQPIAICKQAITDPVTGAYTCGVGRMINSGGNAQTHNTGGWTNFTQTPCDTATPVSVKPLINTGNTFIIRLGVPMGTTGGQVDTVFQDIMDAWTGIKNYDPKKDSPPMQPWPLRLPVVDCPDNNLGPCSRPVGAVEVNVIWINHKNDPQYAHVPRAMTNPTTGQSWTCSTTDTTKAGGMQCWSEFVDAFDLKNILGNSDATYETKSLYFLPECAVEEPAGVTGGENFGILAKIPVLVK